VGRRAGIVTDPQTRDDIPGGRQAVARRGLVTRLLPPPTCRRRAARKGNIAAGGDDGTLFYIVAVARPSVVSDFWSAAFAIPTHAPVRE